jgi:DNA-binding MarR family transcriptional regulator
MNTESLSRFWPLIYSIVREFWAITEPHIEDAAVRNDIPIELYFYGELGLEYFSVEDFQKRDPFTNPEQFEKAFARFNFKDWIFPLPDDRYQVSRKAQEAVRQIVRAGDAKMAGFDLLPETELKRLVNFLKQLTTANLEASEPPEKWAVLNRFRATDERSLLIAQIRESLLDLFAYRDDSQLSAARPHFGQAGIVWDVLGAIWNGNAVNAAQMAERMSFRGYEESDYDVAFQAAVEIGWVEAAEATNTFRLTPKGREVREGVERLTDEHFYRPWSVLTDEELDELFPLLTKLHEKLIIFKKTVSGDSHL